MEHVIYYMRYSDPVPVVLMYWFADSLKMYRLCRESVDFRCDAVDVHNAKSIGSSDLNQD